MFFYLFGFLPDSYYFITFAFTYLSLEYEQRNRVCFILANLFLVWNWNVICQQFLLALQIDLRVLSFFPFSFAIKSSKIDFSVESENCGVEPERKKVRRTFSNYFSGKNRLLLLLMATSQPVSQQQTKKSINRMNK